MKFTQHAALAIVLAQVSPAWSQDTPIFHFFGDSALEQGNYQILLNLTCADFTDYYCGPDGLHRDSNGPVWVEFLGLDVKAAAARPESYGGLNHAISGAHMSSRGEDVFNFPTGVTRQVADWRAAVLSGVLPTNADDVFVIQAGGNDFIIGFEEGMPLEKVGMGIVEDAIANVQALVEGGARSIVVWEVETVDYVGYLIGEEYDDLRANVREVVDGTNSSLRNALAALQTDFSDDVKVITIPHRALVEYMETHARELNFTNGINYCLDFSDGTLCSADLTVQNTYMLFDQVHLTTSAQKVEAAWFEAYIQRDLGVVLSESWKQYDFNIINNP